MKTILLPVLLLALFYGCASIPQGTAVATSPVNMGTGKSAKYDVLGQSEGSAGHFTLFGFIPFGRADIDKAIAEAVASKNGDNLIDVDYTINTSFWFVGNYTSMTVKGKVIKYVEKVSMVGTPTSELRSVISKSEIPKEHIISAGIFSKGTPITYTLEMKQSKMFSTFLSVGYCAFEDEKDGKGFFWGNYSEKHQYLPIVFGGILNSEGLISLPSQYPVSAYLSGGLGLAPDFGVASMRNKALINFGYSIGVGIEYSVLPHLGLGLQFSSYNVLIGDTKFGIDNGDHPSFSNFGLMLRYKP